MGWLFMRDTGIHKTPRAYLDNQITIVRDGIDQRVLRSALVRGSVYYAAVELIQANGDRTVFAIICLVRRDRRASDGMTFGYKDMDESMGPFEAECPTAILDLLTDTMSDYADAWRARCRAYHEAHTAKPKLRNGDTIVFAEPVRFSDGSTHRHMLVRIDPNNPRRKYYQAQGAGGAHGYYRIGRLSRIAYTVEQSQYQVEGAAT